MDIGPRFIRSPLRPRKLIFRLADFQAIAATGINTVRIPVGKFINNRNLRDRLLGFLFGAWGSVHSRFCSISGSSNYVGSANWTEGVDRLTWRTRYTPIRQGVDHRLPERFR